MNLKSTIIFFSLLIQITSAQNIDNDFRYVDTPILTDLTSIHFTKSYGLIAVSDVLIYNNSGEWEIFSPQPDFNVSGAFISSNDEIYAWDVTYSYESQLKVFNKTLYVWEKIEHPLANKISHSFFEAGIGWISGIGEIAYYNGTDWNFLDPPSNHFINNILPYENTIVLYSNSKPKSIFIDERNHWKEISFDDSIYSISKYSEDSFLIHTSSNLHVYEDGNKYTLPFPDFDEKINFFYRANNSELWLCGENGLTAVLKDGNWKQLQPMTQENLLCITQDDKSNIWISGENGIIITNDPSYPQIDKPLKSGFKKSSYYSEAKMIADEYGVAVSDIDKDGYEDIFVVAVYEPNRMYMNIKTILENEASSRNISGESFESSSTLYLGAAFADIDNDGDDDLYVCALTDENVIYLNNGSGYFREYFYDSGSLGRTSDRSNSVAFADVNNDGFLDLFITNEYSSNRLFLNDGSGYFDEVTEKAGVISEGGGTACMFGDLDSDGDADLFITNWSKENSLYKNMFNEMGEVYFENITSQSKTGGFSYTKSNAVVLADINNDNRLDIFVTNRKTSNRLYLNLGNMIFSDVTESFFGVDTMQSYGAVIADFDHDGFQDIYLSNLGANIFYKNVNGEKFIERTLQFNATINGYSTGSAIFDKDNDNDLDIYVANYLGEESQILTNILRKKTGIVFKIEGTKTNRNAVGVTVKLFDESDNKMLGIREISSGSGYGSQNSKRVHFGVQNNNTYKAEIYFPVSKTKKVISNIKSGSTIELSEEEGYSYTLSRAKGFLTNSIKDPELQREFVKFILFILMSIYLFRSGNKRYGLKRRLLTTYTFFTFLFYITIVIIFIHSSYFLNTFVPFVSVIIFYLVTFSYHERNFVKKKSEEEKLNTRNRIARDLHDDLASTLSTTAIYTEALSRDIPNDNITGKELVEKISSLINDSQNAITDIIWSVTPKNDKLNNLVTRLRLILSSNLKTKGIKYKFNSIITNNIILKDEVRRNIFLIFKEAVNNILKHSRADFVEMIISADEREIKFELTDNGIGFDEKSLDKIKFNENVLSGNGINNMKARAAEIGAEFRIISESGTKIILVIKMT